MSVRQQTLRRAADLSVRIIDADGELLLEAPGYLVLRATGTHGTVHEYLADGHGWRRCSKATAWRSALNDMRLGLEPCGQDDCDICTEEEP